MLPSTLVLAAGLSRRMGTPKLLLPWGKHTVIRQVTSTLIAAGIEDIWVVTGHQAGEVSAALRGLQLRTVFNPDYASRDMISSVQAGLAALQSAPVKGDGQHLRGALVCLGDQPQLKEATVRAVLTAGMEADWGAIIIPSHNMRRGHPVLLPQSVWADVLSAQGPLTEVFNRHRNRIRYVTLDTASILSDVDTPDDYRRALSASEDA